MSFSKLRYGGVVGIYCIIRTIGRPKYYVGSAANCMYTRWHIHTHNLCNGKHHSIHLQRAWSKLGANSFEFIMLEECSPDNCISREQYWMDLLDSHSPRYGYNISPTAGSCLGVRRSRETKNLLSSIAKNRSPEVKLKIKQATSTSEVKAKISAAHKGKKVSTATRVKLAMANLGKKLSAEHRSNISCGVRRSKRYKGIPTSF